MKIHEVTESDGSLSAIEPVAHEDGFALKRGGKVMPLPPGAVAAVITRYGAELDPAAKTHEVDQVAGTEGVVRHLRHLAVYDVIARDWLVYEGKAALAATISGALEYLARPR